MPCDRCPCPDACLRWEAMCAFAAAEPQDPVRIRWIRERSARGGGPIAAAPGVRADETPRPGVDETTAAARAAHACPYRSKDAGCGCNGVRCGIRPVGQQVVPIQTCIECIRRYG